MPAALTFSLLGAIIKLMFDYHIHTDYSADCTAPVSVQLSAAASAGLSEICLTDHVDFDDFVDGKPVFTPPDLGKLREELPALQRLYPTLAVKRGAEVALKDAACSDAAYAHIKDADLDFVLGSLHVLDGASVYYPESFEGRTQEQSYLRYLEGLDRVIRTCPYFCAMGHYDFIAKYAPFPERAVKYSLAPDLFDGILKYLVQNGKTLELNTSAWQEDAAWGLELFKRFKELGGEFVTVGSDAHKPSRVGKRVHEAYELLRAAGIRYVATYEKMKPVLHGI